MTPDLKSRIDALTPDAGLQHTPARDGRNEEFHALVRRSDMHAAIDAVFGATRDIASSDVATLQTLVTLFSHSHAKNLRLSMSWDGARVHEALKAMLGRTSVRCQAEDLSQGEIALLRREHRHYKAMAESPPLRRVVNVMVVGKGWHGLYEAQLGTDGIYVALTDASLPAEAPTSVGISATELARSVDERLG